MSSIDMEILLWFELWTVINWCWDFVRINVACAAYSLYLIFLQIGVSLISVGNCMPVPSFNIQPTEFMPAELSIKCCTRYDTCEHYNTYAGYKCDRINYEL